MYVIHSRKLIYFAQPRTATVSVREWLRENEGIEKIRPYPMWPPGWGGHHTIDLPELKGFRERGYKTMCCVRNHWDWLVSIYHWDKSNLKDPPFDVYVNKFLVGPKHYNIYLLQEDVVTHGKKFGVKERPKHLFWLYPQFSDYVMRFETQEQDLGEILGREVRLPRKNTSDRLPYHTYYDGELRTKIYTLFKPEIHDLGYTFQPGGDNVEEGKTDPEPVGDPA
jgi:hypothetical protein